MSKRSNLPPLNTWAPPTGEPASSEDLHAPSVQPVKKLDAPEGLFRGCCSCGWVSQGVESEARARKSAKSHADKLSSRKLEWALAEAALTHHDPNVVMDAVAALNKDRYDVVGIAWEAGTSCFVIFTGEGGTAAIRYTLSADLKTVLVTERISRYRR